MKARWIMKFIVSVLICQGAGFVGSLFTAPAIPNWYSGLDKPVFNPPNWIFAPVWTLLFLLMGITLFMLWQRIGIKREAKRALIIFFVQLMLNITWSVLFFGMHNPLFAFIEIILLWSAILATIVLSFKVSRIAGSLLIPYLLWVSFATVLNFSLWQLNP